jgi:hypothetical protein
MRNITAEEWELVSLFEVTPQYLDPKDPWPYTDALFRVEQGATVLTFAIAPAYRDVRIVLEHSGNVLYELNAMAVVDVRYRREGSTELLDVVLGREDVLTIAVKPAIRLDHAAKRADRE